MIDFCKLVGTVRITTEPEMKKVGEKQEEMLSFGGACSYGKKNGDKWDNVSWYVRCVAFGYPARTMNERVQKGDQLFVIGSFREEVYEKDGVKKQAAHLQITEWWHADQKHTNKGDKALKDAYDKEKAKESEGKDETLPF